MVSLQMEDAVSSSRHASPLLRGDPPRALVVAIDHGMFMGPIEGARISGQVVRRVLEAGPDAVQLTPGIIRRERRELQAAERCVVYRLDTTNVWRSTPLPPAPGYWSPVGSVDDARSLDADVAVAFLLGGWADDSMERDNIRQLGRWARECRAAGLPFMVEPLPISGKVDTHHDGHLVRMLARIAVEIGCDLLKLDFDGDINGFAEMLEDVGVPVLVRGGPKATDRHQYLAAMAAALGAGAAGLVVGRNVFAESDPATAVRELQDLVHSTAQRNVGNA